MMAWSIFRKPSHYIPLISNYQKCISRAVRYNSSNYDPRESSEKRKSSDDSRTGEANMMDPKNKSAVITGAASCSGLTIATEFLSCGGRKVILLDKNFDLGKYSVKLLRSAFGSKKVEFIEADVADFEMFNDVFQESVEFCGGGIDLLFNNAEEKNEYDWEKQVDVNIKGIFGGVLLAFKYMGADNGGKGGIVINKSSTAGLYPMPENPVFCCTKHGINGITRNFGDPFHYNSTKLRVVSVCPGIFDSTLENSIIHSSAYKCPNYTRTSMLNILRNLYPTDEYHRLSKMFTNAFRQAKSGTVWCSPLSTKKHIHIPDRHSFSTVVVDYKNTDNVKGNRQNSDLNFNLRDEPELMDVTNKVAVITAGATGIGYAAAEELLRYKAKGVVLLQRRAEVGEEAVQKLSEQFGSEKVKFIQGDVTKPADFRRAFEVAIRCYEGVDILFNNAGILSDKYWQMTTDINISGVLRGIHLAYKYIGKNGLGKGGVVVNNASIVGIQTLPGAPAYSMSKHAVIGATRSFGDPYHYDRTGVRVVALCPGVTHTDLVHSAGERQFKDEWGKATADSLSSLPDQDTKVTGEAFVDLVRFTRSGTIWVIEGSKLLYVKLPQYTVEK